MKIVLVFDGDDTLWMTEWTYSKAISDFCSYIYTVFEDMSPDINIVYELLMKTSAGLAETWGIERGRLSLAMLKTYNKIFEHSKVEWGVNAVSKVEKCSDEHEYNIFKIGEKPFDFTKHKWVSKARPLLTRLKKRGYKLCLLTSYDGNTWASKSQWLGVARYMTSVKAIPGRKSKQDFIDVSGYGDVNSEENLFYSIGNGKSDILPALDISEKWHGIYVPRGSTSSYFDKSKGEDLFDYPKINDPRVVTLGSLAELRRFDFENFKPTQKSV